MRIPIVTLSLLALAGCVAPSTPEPQPAPMPTKAPPPAPAPVPPTSSDWRDWPLTPGDWRYSRNQFGSGATFGMPGQTLLSITCGNDRQIRIDRPILNAGSMTIRTSSTARVLPVGSSGHPPSGTEAVLPSNDSILDAMGFSRGRFVVEQRGGATLVIPAWPEILRVAEDCRG